MFDTRRQIRSDAGTRFPMNVAAWGENPPLSMRLIALCSVCALHGLAVYLLAASRYRTTDHKTSERRTVLVYIPAPTETSATRDQFVPRVAIRRRDTSRSERQSADRIESADDVIPTRQDIDWYEQGHTAIAEQHDDTKPRERSLNSKPNAIELPKGGTVPRRGDTQRFDDGEIRTWISDECYVSNLPFVTPQLDPNRLNIQCKKGGLTNRKDLFDHLRPDYLGGPKATAPIFGSPDKKLDGSCIALCE